MSEARELVRRQLDLEEEAYALGAVRYRQSRPMPWRTGEDAKKVDEEANLPPGQQLLKQAVVPTAELLRLKIGEADSGKAGRRHSAVKWLSCIAPEEAAYLAARGAVNAAAERQAFQRVAISVGEAIITHIEMVTFSKLNKAGYTGLVRSQHGRRSSSAKRQQAVRKLLEKEGAREHLSVSEKLHLGTFVLDALIEATGFFELDLVKVNAVDRLYMIRPSEAVATWLERQHARCELLNPHTLPMVVRPRRWRSPTTGGYLSRVSGNRLVRALNRQYQDNLKHADLGLVYEAVNHIQETPWRINRGVLEVMRSVWDSGGSIAGLPPREDAPLPTVPQDIETNEDARKAWKKAAAQTHEQNAQDRAARFGLQQRLWLAEKFLDDEAIWFPHSLDFRGRVYPIPATGIHPQADDSGKALLEFSEGKPLGTRGAYWLAVHIANLFGIDKVSFEERVAWTTEHAADIIDSAVMPLDGNRFWTTADSPWMALAACQEYVGYLEQGPDYVSRLPIPLDGSNSGLQHFSALLRDPVGGAAVNLLPASEPQDVYRAVAKAAQDIVEADENPEALPWRGGKVTRAIAKRPTMTFVYSATRFGMQDMIYTTLREIDRDNAAQGLPPHLGGSDNYHAALYLSHVLYGAIASVVSKAQEAMAWLRETAKVASEAGVALEWTTPDGLPVCQNYRVVYGERVKVHWGGKVLKVTLSTTGTTLDGRGQANGIAPNYVHSLDAAHLRAVARAARAAGINSIAVIHDSFGTHAADTDTLVDLLRETFVHQYEPDHLAELVAEIRHQLPDEYRDRVPEPPVEGCLNLEQVRHSRYLFA